MVSSVTKQVKIQLKTTTPASPMLDRYHFSYVAGWVRRVLVTDHTDIELIDALLSYSCAVTVIIPPSATLQSLQAVATAAGRPLAATVVVCDLRAFLSACELQQFFAIFATRETVVELPGLADLARRAIAWNGTLHVTGMKHDELAAGSLQCISTASSPIVSLRKDVGWLLATYPRCGTHMLLSALQQHSKLQVGTELFNHNTATGSHRFNTVRQSLEVGWPKASSGFAVHSSIEGPQHALSMQETMQGTANFWETIPDYTPTILLQRDNLLERYVSQKVAMATRSWNSTDSGKTASSYASVYVGLGELAADIAYVRRCYDKAAAYFKYSLVVRYEDMCEDPVRELRRAQEFLRVDWEDVRPLTVKLTANTLEIVENYTQVKAWCRRNGYGNFLVEEQ